MALQPKRWTTPEEVQAVLRRRWERGLYLRAYAHGEPWQTVAVPVRAPTSAELLDDFDAARRWAETFAEQITGPPGAPWARLEYRVVRGKHLGANRVPARVCFDGLDHLSAFLGTSADVHELDRLLSMTAQLLPEALAWARRHALVVLASKEIWPLVLATASWVLGHDTPHLFLRQLDVEGVDTKFVELNYKLLDQVLCAALSPERIDALAPPGDFARKFGFRPRPLYARFRFFRAQPHFPAGITEVRLRADEVGAAGIEASTVFIVENEVTYLAFPAVPESVVMFGSGYALEAANAQEWLADKEVVYWGDIDTHGFAILNNLRGRLTKVESVLMDHETLLAHRRQWVTEAVPVSRYLPNLTAEEQELFRDLVEDRWGRGVRLEQERVRFSTVEEVLRRWA